MKKEPAYIKYARFRDDLAAAVQIGRNAESDVKDDGACNFDAPSVYLPFWKSNEIRAAAALAGTRADSYEHRDVRAWLIEPVTNGQAHKRTVNAQAMCNELRKRGYCAEVRYVLD